MEIRLEGVTKGFGGKTVIRPTTLRIESGSFTTFWGRPAAARRPCCA